MTKPLLPVNSRHREFLTVLENALGVFGWKTAARVSPFFGDLCLGRRIILTRSVRPCKTSATGIRPWYTAA